MGVYNDGRLRLEDSIVQDNLEQGVLNAANRRMIVVDSTIRRNGGTDVNHHGEGMTSGGVSNGSGGKLTLRRSTVAGNTSNTGGGGIWNHGSLWIADSIVRRNRAAFDELDLGGSGGGIYNDGSGHMTLRDSVVRGNRAADRGGGIFNAGGNVVLLDSSVSANTAGGNGGGIANAPASGAVSLDADSSVHDNTPDECVGTPAC